MEALDSTQARYQMVSWHSMQIDLKGGPEETFLTQEKTLLNSDIPTTTTDVLFSFLVCLRELAWDWGKIKKAVEAVMVYL